LPQPGTPHKVIKQQADLSSLWWAHGEDMPIAVH
jgi:hypothetical protein